MYKLTLHYELIVYSMCPIYMKIQLIQKLNMWLISKFCLNLDTSFVSMYVHLFCMWAPTDTTVSWKLGLISLF